MLLRVVLIVICRKIQSLLLLITVSIDNTGLMISNLARKSINIIKYIKNTENVGISEGRNIGKRNSLGEYSFYMDDDAIISEESKNNFFSSSIRFMDENNKVATLTTRVFDETLNFWRESHKSRYYSINNPEVHAFHGNSYFIRNSIGDLFYLPTIRYAYEDLYLSIIALNKGYINALNDSVYIVHKPLINKWMPGSQSLYDIYIKANASMLTIKCALYPTIYKPMLFLAFITRCFKTSKYDFNMLYASFKLYKIQIYGYHKKIKHSTILEIGRKFGLKKIF